MRQYQIELDQNVVTYIERLNYEYETLKDNVAYMMQHFDERFLEGDLFRQYQDRQIRARINFEQGREEIYEKFVPEKLKQHRINWQIDYRRRLLIVTQFCDCEVDDEAK